MMIPSSSVSAITVIAGISAAAANPAHLCIQRSTTDGSRFYRSRLSAADLGIQTQMTPKFARGRRPASARRGRYIGADRHPPLLSSTTYSAANLNHNSGREGGFIPAPRCLDVQLVEPHRTPPNLFHRE